jgi:hypothetical protein
MGGDLSKNDSGENEYQFLDNRRDVFSQKVDPGKISRELRTIKQSPAYIIGKHLTNSYSSFWKIILLPISLPALAFRILSGKEIVTSDFGNPSSLQNIDAHYSRKSIVFFPTNGVGFGHFTRTLAVARKLKLLDSELEIVFVTTMPTLHPLSDEGFLTYHLPPRYKYEEMEPHLWNSLIGELLETVFSLHRPKMFIFDGAFPYRGVLNAIKDHDYISNVWIRRGMFRTDSKQIPTESINHFDAIIRPGDSAPNEVIPEVEHNVPLIRCNPITILDEDEFASKGELRRRLGIPDLALVCYLQLGAGKINDISDEVRITLDALSNHSQIITVVGESILGDRISYNSRNVRVLRDYPNSMYFQDFDFAIMAAGYNSYHEAIQSSLPTICYPNLKTGMDDQLSRARVAEEVGGMIVVKDRTKPSIESAVNRIADHSVREKMKSNLSLLKRPNGASQISEWIKEKLL